MHNDQQRQDLRGAIKKSAADGNAQLLIESVRSLLALGKPADVMFCANALTNSGHALESQLSAKRLKTWIARSVTLEPVVPSLIVEGSLSNFVLDLHIGGYGSFADEFLNPQSALTRYNADLVLLILDLEDIAGRLPDLCAGGKGTAVEDEIGQCVVTVGQLLKTYRASSPARIVLQGFVVPDLTSLGDVGDANLSYSLPRAVQILNQRLADLTRTIPDCIFFDVDHYAARHGRARWRDTRMFLASRLAVSAENFTAYAQGIVRSISALYRAPRKVLCTDLDNTLWGGILGEDGTDGIVTGAAFPGNSYLEYQRYLKQLASRGILLAIVSKNNEADVREAFQLRSADLAITLDDFVGLKISWDEKSKSIRDLAHELSLGLDSFVFVDDNPVECEAMRQQIPEVAVISAPVEEPWRLVDILSSKSFFDAAVVTADDLNRVNEYKAQAQRAQLESSASNREEFLASLGIVCTFQSALEAPLSRSVQLLSKTNQFNTTTRRRSATEIEDFAANGQAWVIRVRDRFGDAGVVGLALARNEGATCVIDSFLLSCRVIGRGIETALLAFLAENARRTGATKIAGDFIPTKKNAPAASFYNDHNFTSVSTDDSGTTHYEFDLAARSIQYPAWITLEGKESNELSATAVLSS